MAERITASHRLRRILAIVPWVADRDGPTIAEICERFAISRADLLADLDVVFMVGLPPYTPDTLVDVAVEDDRVWIRLGDFFRRPLRLSNAEALALLAAGEAVGAGPDDDGPLARGIAKIASVLGVRLGAEGQLDVSLGSAPGDLVSRLQTAAAEHHLVELDYYSFGRDEHGTRMVEPLRVAAQDGAWYLVAWCHQARDERVFRLDRIASATVSEDRFAPRPGTGGDVAFRGATTDRQVRLALAPGARWVAEHHPVVDVEPSADGGVTASLRVPELTWLVRLLIRLGPDAEVISLSGAPGESVETIRRAVRDAAGRILERYRT